MVNLDPIRTAVVEPTEWSREYMKKPSIHGLFIVARGPVIDLASLIFKI